MAQSKMYETLNPILQPKSVALIGASAKEGKVGRMFMDRFLDTGYQTLYPVNPGADEILGIKAYPSVKAIPGPVDMAIILTPPGAVLDMVKECVEKGVKGVVINSAGFGETGEEGKAREREMVRIAREGDTRLIGPNCIGVYYPAARLPFPLPMGTESGKVGVVSQSGSLADHLAHIATKNGIRFSKAISCGNECDLNAVDFLEYLGEDPDTEIIIAYIEGIRDGRTFHRLAKEVSKKKPIILWKTGVSEAGARAAASHTGALAGSATVWDGVINGSGIVRVKSFEDILDTLYLFYHHPLAQGNRVAIITGPGGPAVGSTDACLEMGLQVPRLSGKTREKLQAVLPPVGASADNPVDLTLASVINPALNRDIIKILGQDEGIDMILIIGIGGEKFQDAVSEAAQEINKPLVAAILMPMDSVLRDIDVLLKQGIPVYSDPRRAIKALARLSEYSAFRRALQG
ncbi:acetate--CoA ligase family protein [Thermodesulfobacteriota bacterium]